jgi:thiol-disulfide isomerase/thioredoxin
MRIVLAFLLLATATCHAGGIAIGDAALPSAGKDSDGNGVDVTAYRGKVVVMTFWASWCTYCLKELPVLENLQKRVGRDRLQVLAVNVDRDKSDYTRIRRKLKDFQLQVTRDEGGDLARAYAVSGLPHLMLIDKAGAVSRIHLGYSEKMLPDFVDEINALLEDPG